MAALKARGRLRGYEYYMEVSWYYLLGGTYTAERAGTPPSETELRQLPYFLTHVDCEAGRQVKTQACQRQAEKERSARRRLQTDYYVNGYTQATPQTYQNVTVRFVLAGDLATFNALAFQADLEAQFPSAAVVNVVLSSASVNADVSISYTDWASAISAPP